MEATAATAVTAAAVPVQPARSRDNVAMVVGLVVIALLCVVCAALVVRGGGYVASTWLPLAIGTAALALLVIVSGPRANSDRFQKVLLALFGALAVWTSASLIWASSTGSAWEAANRTLLYAVIIGLTFVAVRWAGLAGLTAVAGMLLGTIGAVAVATVVILGTSGDPLAFFGDGRLNYPVTYQNGLASFLVIGFWLAMGLASGAGARRKSAPGLSILGPFPTWTQPLLLALSVLLVELALLPQSRGALWTLVLVLPFFVILSPHRFRALINVAIVALPAVLFWSRFSGVYRAIGSDAPVDTSLATALKAIGYSALVVLGAWAVSWLVESRLGILSRRVTLWIGVALAVLVLAGAIGGIVYADQRTGGLTAYVQDRLHEFVSDRGTTVNGGSRFAEVSLNGRLTQWKAAAQAFEDHPAGGLGAQNFAIYFNQHRTTALDVHQAHSLPMELLAELGVPGLLLWLAFVLLTLVRAGKLRFRAHGRATQAVVAAMMTAVISWFIHSSADWLWHLTAVTLPAMMLLGGLVGVSEDQVRFDGAPVADPSPVGSGTPPAAEPSPAVPPPADAPPRRRLRLGRPALAVAAVLLIVSVGLPYLSTRYSDSASRAIATDPRVALARADTAAALDPTSTAPFAVRAAVHEADAARAPETSSARVEQLTLAAEDWVGAIGVEPAGWLYYYNAAATFLAARDAARTAGGASAEELDRSARTYLSQARALNPLSPQIAALERNL